MCLRSIFVFISCIPLSTESIFLSSLDYWSICKLGLPSAIHSPHCLQRILCKTDFLMMGQERLVTFHSMKSLSLNVALYDMALMYFFNIPFCYSLLLSGSNHTSLYSQLFGVLSWDALCTSLSTYQCPILCMHHSLHEAFSSFPGRDRAIFCSPRALCFYFSNSPAWYCQMCSRIHVLF